MSSSVSPAGRRSSSETSTPPLAKVPAEGFVNRVLGKIFMALLDDRISLKKSGDAGTLEQLRSHREIAFYKKLEQERKAAEEEPPARANGINR